MLKEIMLDMITIINYDAQNVTTFDKDNDQF